MKAIVNTNLNERTQLPSVNAPTHKYYKPGDEVNIVEIVNGDPYEGNKVWYKLDNGRYVWSGGVEGIENITSGLGETPFSSSDHYWIHDYNIPEFWAKGLTGKGVKVAILDSGISLPHKDLIIDKKNCEDKSLSKKYGIHDITGHGTHCAGIIKASNNGFGITGIAYDCELFFCKVRNDEVHDDLEFLKQGLLWAIGKNVDVISISQGAFQDRAKLQPILKDAVDRNIIPVCSGGNHIPNVTGDNDILFPARYDECISVGSVDKFRQITRNTLKSPNLCIGAPGSNIKSTFTSNGYEVLSGTSQATPFVCGVLAVILQYCRENNVNYTFDKVKNWLIHSADKTEYQFPIINPISLLEHIKFV